MEKTKQEKRRERYLANKEKITAQRKARYESNKSLINSQNKEWYKNNKEHRLEKCKEYYELNKDEKLQYSKEWYKNNKDHRRIVADKWNLENKDHRIKKQKEWNTAHKDSIKAWAKIWRNENRKLINERQKEWERNKKKIDPTFKLHKNIRNNIKESFKRSNNKKLSNTISILGCSFDKFREHIEDHFEHGMTIENYGLIWHLDHIMPLAIVKQLPTDEEQAECTKLLCHYLNYQPLFAQDNLSKGDDFEPYFPTN